MSGRYEDWARHFGKSTLDQEVVSEFRNAGYDAPPVIERDEPDASVSDGDMTVVVRDPESYGRGGEFGDGVGILAGVTLHLLRGGRPSFQGDLPFDLRHGDTRDGLLTRLGDPDESDDDEFWDVWNIAELELIVAYTDAFEAIESVSVYVPETQ